MQISDFGILYIVGRVLEAAQVLKSLKSLNDPDDKTKQKEQQQNDEKIKQQPKQNKNKALNNPSRELENYKTNEQINNNQIN